MLPTGHCLHTPAKRCFRLIFCTRLTNSQKVNTFFFRTSWGKSSPILLRIQMGTLEDICMSTIIMGGSKGVQGGRWWFLFLVAQDQSDQVLVALDLVNELRDIQVLDSPLDLEVLDPLH